jgi:uncharacterized SAM-binding protein YcdF (DUF218 family)
MCDTLIEIGIVGTMARPGHVRFQPSNGFHSRRWPDWLRGVLVGLVLGGLFLVVLVTVNPETSLMQGFGLMLMSGAFGGFTITRRLLWPISATGTVFVSLALLTPILEPIERALDVSEQPRSVDAIVILGGTFHCDSQELGGSSLGRLVRGLELWRQGFARTITISDSDPVMFGSRCANFAEMSRRIIKRLYPDGGPEIIELERMQTTRTEAEAVARIARERNWREVIVVTSPTHTRRTRATFHEAGVKALMVSAYEPRFDSALRDPADRWLSLSAILREVAGLVKYGLNGWL